MVEKPKGKIAKLIGRIAILLARPAVRRRRVFLFPEYCFA